jgi:hypothetical protein
VRVPVHKKFAELMSDSSPSAIVVQKDFFESKKKTGMRDALLKQAESHRIPIRFLTRRAVKNAFPDCNRNKYTIAGALAKQLPELAPRLPGLRKIWKSEDYRISIFDAVALGVAYFSHRRTPRSSASV